MKKLLKFLFKTIDDFGFGNKFFFAIIISILIFCFILKIYQTETK